MTLRSAHGSAYEEVERIASEGAGTFQKRFLSLLNNPMERDVDLWKAAGARIKLTFDELALIPSANIGSDWSEAIEGVIAMSSLQAKAEQELIVDMMAASLKHSGHVREEANKLSTDELRKVAREGIDDGAPTKQPSE